MRLARGAARGRHPRAGVPSNRRWSVAVGHRAGCGKARHGDRRRTRHHRLARIARQPLRAALEPEPFRGARARRPPGAPLPHRRPRQGKAVDGPRGVRVSLDLGPQGPGASARHSHDLRAGARLPPPRGVIPPRDGGRTRQSAAAHPPVSRQIPGHAGQSGSRPARRDDSPANPPLPHPADSGHRNPQPRHRIRMVDSARRAGHSERTDPHRLLQAARAAADVDEGERVARVGFLRETAPPPHGILRHETLGRPAPAHRRPPPGGDLSHRAGDRHPLHRTQLPGVRHGASRIRPPYLRRVRGLERGLRFLDGLVPAAARGAGPRDVRGSVAQQLAHMAARHLDAGDKASGMRRTAHSGVGRDPDGAVRTPDAFAEAGADAGSRLGSHQRDAQHTHHSDRGHRGDLGRHLAGRDAGRAVCGRTAVVARGADDGVRLRTAGRAPLARPHRGGAHPPR